MLVCGIGAATVTNFLKAKSHFCYTKAGKGMANCRLCCQKKKENNGRQALKAASDGDISPVCPHLEEALI